MQFEEQSVFKRDKKRLADGPQSNKSVQSDNFLENVEDDKSSQYSFKLGDQANPNRKSSTFFCTDSPVYRKSRTLKMKNIDDKVVQQYVHVNPSKQIQE